MQYEGEDTGRQAARGKDENVLGKGPEAGIKLLGSELRGTNKMTKRPAAARFNVDFRPVRKDFNCYIIQWVQDKIYFIYFDYLFAHCVHYSYNEIKASFVRHL